MLRTTKVALFHAIAIQSTNIHISHLRYTLTLASLAPTYNTLFTFRPTNLPVCTCQGMVVTALDRNTYPKMYSVMMSDKVVN
jgi:hypothetical protein